MQSGEQAAVELRKYAASDADRRKGIRVRRLIAPSLASRIAAAMGDRRQPWEALAAELDQLSERKRAKVFGALSPEMGADLSRWWEWSCSAPYQRGWDRRAYRSPDPADSRAGRWHELGTLLVHGCRYPQPLTWQASWLMHVGGPAPLGGVLASAIDAGNREIAAILRDSLQGRHPVSGPSSQAYAALLAADDPAGWEVVETLLVSAQRAEGLRQAILEAADVAHPEAFARLLSRVVELDLSRFAGTVRAVGVWFGDELTVRQGRVVSDALRTTLGFLQRPPSAADLREADAATAYLGLWTLAVRDATATVPVAAALLNHSDQGHRLAAARLLTDLALPSAGEELVCALEDPALPVYAAAVAAWPTSTYGKESAGELPRRVRAALTKRVETLGKTRDVETGVLGHRVQKVGAALAADVVIAHSPGDRLDPLDGRGRVLGRPIRRGPPVRRRPGGQPGAALRLPHRPVHTRPWSGRQRLVRTACDHARRGSPAGAGVDPQVGRPAHHRTHPSAEAGPRRCGRLGGAPRGGHRRAAASRRGAGSAHRTGHRPRGTPLPGDPAGRPVQPGRPNPRRAAGAAPRARLGALPPGLRTRVELARRLARRARGHGGAHLQRRRAARQRAVDRPAPRRCPAPGRDPGAVVGANPPPADRRRRRAGAAEPHGPGPARLGAPPQPPRHRASPGRRPQPSAELPARPGHRPCRGPRVAAELGHPGPRPARHRSGRPAARGADGSAGGDGETRSTTGARPVGEHHRRRRPGQHLRRAVPQPGRPTRPRDADRRAAVPALAHAALPRRTGGHLRHVGWPDCRGRHRAKVWPGAGRAGPGAGPARPDGPEGPDHHGGVRARYRHPCRPGRRPGGASPPRTPPRPRGGPPRRGDRLPDRPEARALGGRRADPGRGGGGAQRGHRPRGAAR